MTTGHSDDAVTPKPCGFGWSAVHILALSALAVAQPVLDVVARSAEFLVAHRADSPDLVGLVLVLVLILPAPVIAVAWLAGMLSRRLQQGLVLTAIFSLSALLALQIAKRAGMGDSAEIFTASGVLAAIATAAYWRAAIARSFASALAVAVVAVPAAFLLNSSVAKFWRPIEAVALPPALAEPTVPIVMIVFDQLPLASLLAEHGGIDARLYPSFAALARGSTWFRAATAVSERTGHALPALVTGRYPRRDTLPRTSDHPDNLFTWLRGYDIRAREPLTDLCPSSVCGRRLESVASRLGAMLTDLAAVYLHVVAPPAMESRLPPIYQNWRGFDVPLWRRRWGRNRVADRRADFLQFVEEIEARSDRPTLHFGHFLLPHEPYIYYATGRRYAAPNEPLLGLEAASERWTDQRWAVATSYQRHLQQVRLVDRLLGTLIDRLKRIGLYDSALLVIAADHGASFRPGDNFRTPTRSNYADIMSIPLFVKAPRQRDGRVDDRVVETIDVLPTIANLLGTALPWKTDGASAFDDGPRRERQRLFYHDARTRGVFNPRDIMQGRQAALRLKLDLFGSPVSPDWLVGLGAAPRVLGRRVETFVTVSDGETPRADIFMDLRSRQAAVTRDPDFVPGLVSGFARAGVTSRQLPQLAIVVDGVVQAVARPFSTTGGRHARWEALLPEEALQRGVRRVEVFEIVERGGGPVALHATGAVAQGEGPLNLLSRTVQMQLQATESGFYPEEYLGDTPFRWTSGVARLTFRIDPERPPQSLAIGILQAPERQTLRLRVDGCVLHSGPIPAAPWHPQFPLDECSIEGPDATIEFVSQVFVPGPHDTRELGVALGYVALGES